MSSLPSAVENSGENETSTPTVDATLVAAPPPAAAPTTPTTPTPSSPPPKKETTFHSLPAELRNRIYALSESFNILQCRICTKTGYQNDRPKSPAFLTNSIRFPSICVAGRTPLQHHLELGCVAAWRLHPLPRLDGPVKARIFVGGRCEPAARPPPYLAGAQSVSGAQQMEFLSTPQWDAVVQPPITKVSKLVRSDTLPMFYGDRQFYFTIFEHDPSHGVVTVLRWLKTIGPSNAACLRNLAIVYSRKQTGNYIKRVLIWEMAKAGVDVSKGVVRLVRLQHPFCHCGSCVLSALEKNDGEEAGGVDVSHELTGIAINNW